MVLRVKGYPLRFSLVATDGMTSPISFGQGSGPEILGTVIVGVHHLSPVVFQSTFPVSAWIKPYQRPSFVADHGIEPSQ